MSYQLSSKANNDIITGMVTENVKFSIRKLSCIPLIDNDLYPIFSCYILNCLLHSHRIAESFVRSGTEPVLVVEKIVPV